MRLPLLSDYVHYAIADIVGAFIAPNAFTMDVSRLLLVSIDQHKVLLAPCL